jgi:hypothetical protein
MQLYCSRCEKSLPEAETPALLHGRCNVCEGQLLVGVRVESFHPIQGLVALTFPEGVGVAEPMLTLLDGLVPTAHTQNEPELRTETHKQHLPSHNAFEESLFDDIDLSQDDEVEPTVPLSEELAVPFEPLPELDIQLPTMPNFGDPYALPEVETKSDIPLNIDDDDDIPPLMAEENSASARLPSFPHADLSYPEDSQEPKSESTPPFALNDVEPDISPPPPLPPPLPKSSSQKLPELKSIAALLPDAENRHDTAKPLTLLNDDLAQQIATGFERRGTLMPIILTAVVTISVVAGIIFKSDAVLRIINPEKEVVSHKTRTLVEAQEALVKAIKASKSKKHGAALKHAQLALKLNPKMSKAHLLLATTHASLNHKTKAVTYYKQYLAIAPINADTKKTRREVRAILKEYKKSLNQTK